MTRYLDAKITFRVTKEFKRECEALGDLGPLLREFLRQQLVARQEPHHVQAEVRKHRDELQRLEQIKARPIDMHQDQDILNKWQQTFNDRGLSLGDPDLAFKWVDAHVQEALRRAGYRGYKTEDILRRFMGMETNQGSTL